MPTRIWGSWQAVSHRPSPAWSVHFATCATVRLGRRQRPLEITHEHREKLRRTEGRTISPVQLEPIRQVRIVESVPAGRDQRLPRVFNFRDDRKAARAARRGSKTAKILELLEPRNGATMKEIMKATGCQPHSVRGFLSGTLRKKLRIRINFVKRANNECTYEV